MPDRPSRQYLDAARQHYAEAGKYPDGPAVR